MMADQAVADARLRGREVLNALDAQLRPLREAGLADLKAKVFVSRDTTVQGLSVALASVLRRYSAGEAKPIVID